MLSGKVPPTLFTQRPLLKGIPLLSICHRGKKDNSQALISSQSSNGLSVTISLCPGLCLQSGGRLHDGNRLGTSSGLILSNHTTVFVCLLWKMGYFNENCLPVGLIAVTLDSALSSWPKTGPVWAPGCTVLITRWCQVRREFQWLIKLPNSTEYPRHSTSLVAEW